MYQIGSSVTIIINGAQGTIVGIEEADDGSFTYRIKYTQPDGNTIREWFGSTQFTI